MADKRVSYYDRVMGLSRENLVCFAVLHTGGHCETLSDWKEKYDDIVLKGGCYTCPMVEKCLLCDLYA